MGILDDAIKDHLDLKRRRGTDEPEIKRLEDEAFGPPGRPDASGAADAAIANALATPGADTAVEERPSSSDRPEVTLDEIEAAAPEPPVDEATVSETPPVPDGPAPEEPPPAPEKSPEGDGGDLAPSDSEPAQSANEPPASGDSISFHDFAAEEGLVDAGEPALDNPFVEDVPEESVAVEPPAEEAPAAETPPAESIEDAPAPPSDDTQVHDMAKELGLGDDASEAPAGEETTADEALGELELTELDLDLELDDDEIELSPTGNEPESQPESPEEDDDVLEKTPEFLRDAPESDRLWFEQGKPKDFDFDEDEE